MTSGWASTLQRHLQRHPEIGLIGPVTNNIGNQAKVDIDYASLVDMPQAARRYTCRHLGEVVRLPTLAFFCVMMPRSTYTRIGPLDEAYGRDSSRMTTTADGSSKPDWLAPARVMCSSIITCRRRSTHAPRRASGAV